MADLILVLLISFGIIAAPRLHEAGGKWWWPVGLLFIGAVLTYLPPWVFDSKFLLPFLRDDNYTFALWILFLYGVIWLRLAVLAVLIAMAIVSSQFLDKTRMTITICLALASIAFVAILCVQATWY